MIEETLNFILDNHSRFETHYAWDGQTILTSDKPDNLCIQKFPDCMNCEEDCECSTYDVIECMSYYPITINSDGSINFKEKTNISKEEFIENWENYI